MRRSLFIVALVVVVLLTALAGAATGSPQPDPVCSVCEDSTLDDHRGQSSVTVDVRENGDTEWQIEVEIANETLADELRDDPSTLTRSQSYRDSDWFPWTPLVDDPHSDPSVTVTDDDVLVVEFVDRNAVRSPAGGTLLVDYLHGTGVAGGFDVNVDRFELRGPEGYVVANDPSEALVSEDAVTWTGEKEIGDVFVVFAPEDAGAKDLRTAAAKGVALAPVVVGNLPIVLLPAGIFGVLLGALAVGTRRIAGAENPRALGVGAAIVAVLGALSIPVLFRIAGTVPHGSGWVLAPAVALLGVVFVETDRQTVNLAVLGATGVFALELAATVRIAGAPSPFALLFGMFGAVLVPVIAAPLLIAAALAVTLRSRGR